MRVRFAHSAASAGLPTVFRRFKESGKNFRYRDIRNVYTIVLFEKSPQAFHAYPETCYHFFEQKSDTGLEMELIATIHSHTRTTSQLLTSKLAESVC